MPTFIEVSSFLVIGIVISFFLYVFKHRGDITSEDKNDFRTFLRGWGFPLNDLDK